MKISFFFTFLIILQISVLVKSFAIFCYYTDETNRHIGEVYLCSTVVDDSSAVPIVTEVTGTHIPDRSHEDVTSIFIRGNWVLTSIPRDLAKFFPNLRAFSIWWSNIEILHGSELNEYGESLEVFDIFNSNLHTISSRFFEQTPKIVAVYFGNSRVERVGHDLFTSLNTIQLQWISFQVNTCINQTASTQEEIQTIIDDLRILCPFDG